MTRKTAFCFFFFWVGVGWGVGWGGGSWFKFNNLGLALGTNLKFYNSVTKVLKVKVRKYWGVITTFVEITGKKLVGDLFAPPSPTILNRIESYCIKMECTWNSKMATQKVDRFCHSCGDLYDENNSFCVKCCNNRRSTLDSKGDTGLQGRIQRF